MSAGALAFLGVGALLLFSQKAGAASADNSAPDVPAMLYTPPAPGVGITIPPQYLQDVDDAAAAYGTPIDILARLLYTESRFNPQAYNARSGAMGMAQFLPATADWLGVDPYDATSAIFGASKYLAYLADKFPSWDWAVAAYNWGEGNIASLLKNGFVVTSKGTKLTTPPNETRQYVAFITGGSLA